MYSEMPSISGLSVRHLGNTADKNMLKTYSFSICRELSNEPLHVEKFQVVPEIVGGPALLLLR
jgi:hypothetical protein